jgi:hypothetical protein
MRSWKWKFHVRRHGNSRFLPVVINGMDSISTKYCYKNGKFYQAKSLKAYFLSQPFGVGFLVGTGVGFLVRSAVGFLVGAGVVGAGVGCSVGAGVGFLVGARVGFLVGAGVGFLVRAGVGLLVLLDVVGKMWGAAVAFSVGAALVSRIMNAMTKAKAKEIKVEYFIFSILNGRVILLCGIARKEINFCGT